MCNNYQPLIACCCPIPSHILFSNVSWFSAALWTPPRLFSVRPVLFSMLFPLFHHAIAHLLLYPRPHTTHHSSHSSFFFTLNLSLCHLSIALYMPALIYSYLLTYNTLTMNE
ncbi:hypothetical protein B0H11DRAFT_1971640 [Mycena galericulata]|nr:hypothetical protein B0H11DRAFT_1971640 [Mycena galericulata]